ncbi:hypothetical protein AYI70_g5178 [Smittium culicis]|uniref:Swiss Army Knife 2H phosphoesterase domain-containing protein n=1 Tax=Smittium culicis TaxID=133412 RepID=A0A1R1XVU8_9FUNG|nr:hypothetical protein AYI70_g5178 [Smittium culicis]
MLRIAWFVYTAAVQATLIVQNNNQLVDLNSARIELGNEFQKSGLNTPNFGLSKDIYKADKLEFIKHEGDEAFGKYLAMNIPYQPVKNLFDAVNKTIGNDKLNNPGSEAHITIITPPEYEFVLKKAGVTIEEVNDIAQRAKIQKAKFEAFCLGRSCVEESALRDRGSSSRFSDSDRLCTYFIVVKDTNKDLLRIRKRIFDLYVSKGGERSWFDPKAFWPHITIGFDIRDFHIQDGIFKGSNSCMSRLKLI